MAIVKLPEGIPFQEWCISCSSTCWSICHPPLPRRFYGISPGVSKIPDVYHWIPVINTHCWPHLISHSITPSVKILRIYSQKHHSIWTFSHIFTIFLGFSPFCPRCFFGSKRAPLAQWHRVQGRWRDPRLPWLETWVQSSDRSLGHPISVTRLDMDMYVYIYTICYYVIDICYRYILYIYTLYYIHHTIYTLIIVILIYIYIYVSV